MLSIASKIFPNLNVPAIYAQRPNWIIVMELISTIPLDFVLEPTIDSVVYYRLLSMVDLLRLPRCMFYFYYNRKMVGNKKVLLLFVQCIFSSSILLLATFYTLYITTCFGQNCAYDQTWENLKIAFVAITNNGFYDYDHDSGRLFVATCSALIAFCGITIPTVGELITVFTSDLKHKYAYMYRLQRIRMTLHDNKNSSHIYTKVMQFYEVLWKHRNGHGTNTRFLRILPPAIKMELATDISWYALKHSKLFQHMDLPFLRAIALVMKHKFATAGEYLYQKGKNKHKMIYIVSGIVQVISEEDGETPLISFSAGTCFGETSLILNNNSTFSVVCKEYSEIHVLEMKNYASVTRNFPKQALKLRKMVYNRLYSAMHLKRISMYSNVQHGISEKDKPTLMWINSTLHNLMRKNEKSSKHDYQNVFLREDFGKEVFDQMQFTAKNLDLLAITERIELVADTVFLKSSFPCVFRPNSVVLHVWDFFICLIAFFMGFVIPYYSLVEHKTPNWHIALMKVITIIYWLDVYVQVSTAFRTKDELIISIKGIFVRRLENMDFIFDLIAAYPMEMYSCVVINRTHPQSFACLYLNRVLKMWKLKTVLEKYEGTTPTQVMVYNYLKYVFLYAYVIYITACIMFALNCFLGICKTEIEGSSTFVKFSWVIFSATQLITGIALQTESAGGAEFNVTYILLMYLALLIYVATLMEVSTIHTLLRLARLKVQSVYLDIKSVLVAHKAMHKFNSRTINYLRTQWKYSEGQEFVLRDRLMQQLPTQLCGFIKENAFASLVKKLPLFQELSDDLIYQISLYTEVKMFPPKTVLSYAGEIDLNFYLILEGQCSMISPLTRSKEVIIGPGQAINLLEVCAHTRIVSTAITLTHAKMLTFSVDDMKRVFTCYPGEMQTFYDTLMGLKFRETLANSLHGVSQDMHYVFDLEHNEDNPPSFHKIGYNLQVDSEEEFDYYIPFDRLGIFSFVRFLLMRRIVMPFGRFIFVWEGVRSFLALLSSLLYVINPITTCTGCVWKYLLLFLDLSAWCDIYVKFHIGYYNDVGILVTHPLKTAQNYLHRSFLIDLLAVFPIDIFFKFETIQDNKLYTLLHANRLLQLYRFCGYFNILDKEYIQPSKILSVFRHIPQVLVVCNVLAAVISNIDCDFHSDIPASENYGTGVICSSSSFYNSFNFTKPYHPLDVHLLSLYFASSAITMAGMQGFTFRTLVDNAFCSFCSFLGTFIQMYIVGSVNAIYSVKSSSLRQYQEEMKEVKEYFKRNRAATGVYHSLIKYFEINWRKKRGKDIHKISKQFDKCLYQDLLYHIYGKILVKYSVFREGSEPFFRVLLPETIHETITNGIEVISVSDIKTKMYIVVNGCFDVIAPDESVLTTLGVGSMFGNLDDYPHLRQTLGYTSSGHAEILWVKAVQFHAILKNFPDLYTRFKELTAIHIDFVVGRKPPVRTDDLGGEIDTRDLTKITIFQLIFSHIFHPESRGTTIWRTFILIVVCYIAPMLTVYSMAFNSFYTPCLVFEYLCDILFAVNFYIYYHTAYENDIGVLIKDKTMIQRRVNKEKLHVIFSIMCMIPYDFFVWVLPLSFHLRSSVLEWFRITKVYRLVNIYKFFSQQDRRLNVNMLYMQALYLLFMISLLLHFFTCVSVVVGCLSANTMYPPIQCEYLHYNNQDLTKKLQIYMEQFYIVIMCFVKCAQTSFYPVSSLTTSFYTLYMIVNVIFTSLILTHILIITKMPWRLQGKYERNITQILNYMEKESASVTIMNRVWMYVRLLWKRQKGSNYPPLIDTAPYNLKRVVLNKCFAHHIHKNPVFRKCHEDFKRQLVPRLESYTYFQGDYIVFKGTVDDCMYFIHEGEITVLSEDTLYKEDVVGTLVVGQSFGILPGLTALLPHAYSFRSSSTSIVLTLNRKKWGKLLRFFPASRETIYEVASGYTGF